MFVLELVPVVTVDAFRTGANCWIVASTDTTVGRVPSQFDRMLW
jgi:hypothetical protein